MTETAILFLHALTGLHPGSGTALGTVDLPVQRERHSDWPVISASSVKGVLRDACRRAGMKEQIATLFGPDTSSADKHAGALGVSDARLIAFPVRSLAGVFSWTTSPTAWSRMQRDLAVFGSTTIPSVPNMINEGEAFLPKGSLSSIDGDLVLEEFAFSAKEDDAQTKRAHWLANNGVNDDASQDRMRRSLALLPDGDFTYFTKHATEVTARIALDYQTKAVRKGALFYEEFLPPETLFYVVIFADDSRNIDDPRTADEVMSALEDAMPTYLQIGAGETTGKGFCAARLLRFKEVIE